MKKIVINRESLRKLEITGDMTDLEIVDVQTATLKTCFLTDLVTAKKEVTVFFKYTVPSFYVVGEQSIVTSIRTIE
jgi:hypothetical protein